MSIFFTTYFSRSSFTNLSQLKYFVILSVSYALLGYLGIKLANLSYGISLIWPPIGIAIALLLRWGLNLWPALVVGGLALQLLVSEFSLLQALALSFGSALVIVLHCFWLQHEGFDRRLEQVSDMLRFILIAILSCSAVLALFGITVLMLIGIIPINDFFDAWLNWFLGDVTGVLIFGLALLIFDYQKLAVILEPKNLLALCLMLVISSEIFIFNQSSSGIALTLLPMICLLWIATRTNLVVTTWVVMCFSSLAIYSVYLNAGIFATLNNPTIGTWLYMASMGLVSLIFSVNAVENRLNYEMMRHAISATKTGIWDLRLEDQLLFINANLRQNLGYEAAPLKKTLSAFKHLIDPKDYPNLINSIQAYLEKKVPQLKLIIRLQHHDGSWRDKQIEGAVTERSFTGKPVRLSGTLIDVTELQQQQRLLSIQAMTDELTGIANRRAFIKQLNLYWHQYQRDKTQSFYAILIDIDFFKRVNDNFGHDCGDKVLQGFSKLIQKRLRQADYFARLGGEEFVILAIGNNQKDILAFAEQLRLAVSELTFDANNSQPLQITASFGIAECTTDIDCAEDILSNADKALYQAKANGRNNVVLFSRTDNNIRYRVN